MDALILSCGTGGGHDAAGKAVYEEMRRRGHHVTMLNPYTIKSTRLSNRINRIYISIVQHMPKAFGVIYMIGNLYRRLPFRSPVYFVNRAMNSVMKEYFAEHHFDIVIMPHLFPAEIMTNMKLHGMDIPKTMFIATDYVCIPFTEETDCDAYIIPAADLVEDFTRRGIPQEKIHPLGIPTSRRFRSNATREQEKLRLGLDADKKYILVAGGSMGGGNIEKAISKLQGYFSRQKDIGIIVICGSNRKLFQKLNRRASENFIVLEYTDQMDAYMRACHLFITKPGGLSSTEAAVCNVPLLHTSVIPGCESYNARYFARRGMSIEGALTDKMFDVVKRVLTNQYISEKMGMYQRQRINSNAAEDICNLAEQMVLKENLEKN